jgi:ACT domain-containing protein
VGCGGAVLLKKSFHCLLKWDLFQDNLLNFFSEVLKLKDISVKKFLKYRTTIKEFDNMIDGCVEDL